MAEHTNLDAYYLGTVQIRSRNLEFKAHDTESDHCTGCYIQGIQHNLPALITIDEYRRMLVSNRISEDILYGIGFVPQIFLSERVKLPCLHGKLHLEFAKICDDGDYLWTQVDLYNSVAASDMIYTLRQHYKQHVQVCDGEKYLHIRYLESTGQLQQAKRWRRSLGNKSRAMKQMLRCSWLNECLERLRPMRSLWHGLQIGSFPLILSWRCEQEITNYLLQMAEMWYGFMDNNFHWCDPESVRQLEGLAPRWSARDRTKIEDLFRTSKIFYRIPSGQQRDEVFHRVLATDGLVLSFKTFFQHVKLLGPRMMSLRGLLSHQDLHPQADTYESGPARLPSVRDVLLTKYFKGYKGTPTEALLQYSEHSESPIQCENPALISYWQLCLSLFRYPKHETTQAKPRVKNPRAECEDPPHWLIQLGQMAGRLGFDSARISALCSKDPDLARIYVHMKDERPASRYSVLPAEFQDQARSRKRGQEIFKLHPPKPEPLMTTDEEVPLLTVKSHSTLFLPVIWSALAQERRYSLTGYGTLVLILSTFFDHFGSGQVSESHRDPPKSTSVRRGPEQYPDLQMLDAGIGSISPSVYSMAAIAASPSTPAPASRGKLFFWRLSADQRSLGQPQQFCDYAKDDVKRIVNILKADEPGTSFMLVDRLGRLKICPGTYIFHRIKSAKCKNQVFYTTSDRDRRFWLTRELKLIHHNNFLVSKVGELASSRSEG